MRRSVLLWALCICFVGLVGVDCAQAEMEFHHRFGVGAHYWRKLEDIDVASIEDDGLSWLISYQLRPSSLIKFEADLEILPEDFQGLEEQVFAPQVYALVGGTVYGAVGVGWFYSDGDWADDPFWTLRAGVDFAVLPWIYLDLHASYRFESWDTFEGSDIDVDTLEAGLFVRVEI